MARKHGSAVHREANSIDDHRRDNTRRHERFLGQTRFQQKRGAQSPLIARESTEEARERPAKGKPARRESQCLKTRRQFQQRKQHDQAADDGLHWCDLEIRASEGVLTQGWLLLEERQGTCPEYRCDGRRHAEFRHDGPVGLPGHQPELEEIVGEMHDGRRRDGERQGEEQGEHRHQDRSQTEA